MMDHEIKFVLHLPNQVGLPDEDEHLCRSRAGLWSTLASSSDEYKFESPYGGIAVKCDWSGVWPPTRPADVPGALTDGGVALAAVAGSIGRALVPCSVAVPEVPADGDVPVRFAAACLDHFLYLFFIAANLAAPGACNFHGTSFEVVPGGSTRRLQLDPILFADAWTNSRSYGWPAIRDVSFDKVWQWFINVGLKFHHVADSQVERALFSLLDVCFLASADPSALLSAAHALEAVYDTPHAGVKRSLIERAFLVLGNPTEYRKVLRTRIGDFYDLRSHYVHGRLNVTRPSPDEVFDPAVNEFKDQILEALHVPIAVLVATFQTMVINGWKRLEFAETFRGIAFS